MKACASSRRRAAGRCSIRSAVSVQVRTCSIPRTKLAIFWRIVSWLTGEIGSEPTSATTGSAALRVATLDRNSWRLVCLETDQPAETLSPNLSANWEARLRTNGYRLPWRTTHIPEALKPVLTRLVFAVVRHDDAYIRDVTLSGELFRESVHKGVPMVLLPYATLLAVTAVGGSPADDHRLATLLEHVDGACALMPIELDPDFVEARTRLLLGLSPRPDEPLYHDGRPFDQSGLSSTLAIAGGAATALELTEAKISSYYDTACNIAEHRVRRTKSGI